MKKTVNHSYQKFHQALYKTDVEDQRWQGLVFTNLEPTRKLWDSMSSRSKGKVVSDSRWNHYPMRSYTKSSKKRFGNVVQMIVEKAIEQSDADTLRVLVNKSEGVFAIHMLDHATSKMRIKMSKRLSKSPDTRVRTRCARILPINHMGEMLKDKSYSVRNIAITRVGMDNCYKDFIPSTLEPRKKDGIFWYMSWLNRQALKLSDKEELISLIDEARNLDSNKVNVSGVDMIVSALIKRLTQEEALYFIGLGEDNPYVKRALQEKMGL